MEIDIASPHEGCGLYFHIPFCTRKCHYCHFYVVPDSIEGKRQLLEGFLSEWKLRLPQLAKTSIRTLYFGGGTPSLFGVEAIATVIDTIKSSGLTLASDIEITLEANPEEISLPLMRGYHKAGVNRVSIGLQTLDSPLLHTLGRLHSGNKALEAVEITAASGFRNITVDLMYDLPRQTLDLWKSTLNTVVGLPIQHLSLYNLTIEPHTLFYKKQAALKPELPSPEVSLEMYRTAIQILEGAGFAQYEISAFAQPGFYSRHNVGYWIGRPFLGFGPSAYSFWEGQRFSNVANLRRYCSMLEEGVLPADVPDILSEDARRRELLAVRLRLLQGVSLEQFQHHYGMLQTETLRTIQSLIEEGMLCQRQGCLALTERGVLFYDTVASEII